MHPVAYLSHELVSGLQIANSKKVVSVFIVRSVEVPLGSVGDFEFAPTEIAR